MPTPVRTTLTLAASAAALTTLTGCFASGSSSAKVEGTYVSSQTLAMLEPEVSTESDVLALLGTPTSTMHRADGEKVLVYDGRKRARSSGSVLFVAGASSKVDVRKRVYVLLRDGLMVEAWSDPADLMAGHEDESDIYDG
ncbi:MAG: hypothetical protein AAGD00_05560 [Planctomycetota bacterium]